MSNWVHPQCEACWVDRNQLVVPVDDVDAEPIPFTDAVAKWPDNVRWIVRAIKSPVRLSYDMIDTERCCWCGRFTIFGVYVRDDPSSLDLCLGHPDAEEDDGE